MGDSIEELGIPELKARLDHIKNVLYDKQQQQFEKELQEQKAAAIYILKKRPKDQSVEEAYEELNHEHKYVIKRHKPLRCSGTYHERKPTYVEVNVFDPSSRWCEYCDSSEKDAVPEEVKKL